jgi:hypothetical protein
MVLLLNHEKYCPPSTCCPLPPLLCPKDSFFLILLTRPSEFKEYLTEFMLFWMKIITFCSMCILLKLVTDEIK